MFYRGRGRKESERREEYHRESKGKGGGEREKKKSLYVFVTCVRACVSVCVRGWVRILFFKFGKKVFICLNGVFKAMTP